MTHTSTRWIAALALALGACQPAEESDDYGVDGQLEASGPLGKSDSAQVAGPSVESSPLDTQVWSVRNQWEDRSTAEARQAGIAWPASSGLSWDEKYARWVQAMKKTPSAGYGDTFVIETPYGKNLDAPKLECSEVAMFLRVSFASWYGLPFFLTAVDGSGTRIFFGHFGVRTASGRYASTPAYRLQYKDYSSMTADEIADRGWPQDAKLRTRGLAGGGDDNDFVAAGARSGAYFDELHLNKRVGWFLLFISDYLGSMNLADARNAYHLKPQALRAGDIVLERWQRQGIGDTAVIKQVIPLDSGALEAQYASGSMPRRQPKWADAVATKAYLTQDITGGEGSAYDGTPYVKLGGGLHRYRVAKSIGGRWVNTWMKADEASWISDSDYDALKKRPAQFQTLLGEVPPEQKRDAILRAIDDARTHLRQYPASCAARESRERAFGELYKLGEQHFSLMRKQIDQQYRKKEDYVFAPLVYTQSKTCCWNSSTAAMFKLVMAHVDAQEKQGAACAPPPVFKATQGGGYAAFKAYAASVGRAAEWRPWSEDEPCLQRSVAEDLEAPAGWTPYCELSLFGTAADQ